VGWEGASDNTVDRCSGRPVASRAHRLLGLNWNESGTASSCTTYSSAPGQAQQGSVQRDTVE